MIAGIRYLFPKLLLHLLYRNHRYVGHPNPEFLRVIYARHKFYVSYTENYRKGADEDHALSTPGPSWISRKCKLCGARAKEFAFMYDANDCFWSIILMG
ncbi:hypothetical protein CEXT_513701 [Caerostris extrusa]|uniref:Uncharacterized protein n=1 Tax=Caerostris extrusa TaxID=172846 RepID=A0AAV4RT82_CAEEX|nr:hypothetical protein CEXT_513701 [Caerostris extrusa]